MRKLNSILAAVIMVLFVEHAVLGSLLMLDIAPIVTKIEARIMLVLIAAHVVISCILTVKAIKTWKVTGAPYFKENSLFWARRISGVAIMILLGFHAAALMSATPDKFTLPFFGTAQLIVNILFAVTTVVHVVTNVKPMLISFGIRKLRSRAGEILFIISVLLVLFIVGFIVYFIRWNTI